MAEVLVVDDDADLLSLVLRGLRITGCRRSWAGVDALVLDVTMPDLSGFRLLSLRAVPERLARSGPVASGNLGSWVT